MRKIESVRKRSNHQFHTARRRVRAHELSTEYAGEAVDLGGERRAVTLGIEDRVHAKGQSKQVLSRSLADSCKYYFCNYLVLTLHR